MTSSPRWFAGACGALALQACMAQPAPAPAPVACDTAFDGAQAEAFMARFLDVADAAETTSFASMPQAIQRRVRIVLTKANQASPESLPAWYADEVAPGWQLTLASLGASATLAMTTGDCTATADARTGHCIALDRLLPLLARRGWRDAGLLQYTSIRVLRRDSRPDQTLELMPTSGASPPLQRCIHAITVRPVVPAAP